MATTDYILRKLREELAAKRLTVFAGTGVSVSSSPDARSASWTGLMESGRDRCLELYEELSDDWAERITCEIGSGSLTEMLAAAYKIAKYIKDKGNGRYQEWLEESVGTLSTTNDDLLKSIRLLDIPILTTNYDTLIADFLQRKAVPWTDRYNVPRFLNRQSTDILHLHGVWNQPDSVIFDPVEYGGISSDAPIQQTLRSLMTMHCLLFIGCGEGLLDPNIGKAIEWCSSVDAGSQYMHYALVDAETRKRIERDLPKSGKVTFVTYGEKYTDLAPFVARIRSGDKPITLSPKVELTKAGAKSSVVHKKGSGISSPIVHPTKFDSADELMFELCRRDGFQATWDRGTYNDQNGLPIVYWPVKLRAPTPIHAIQAFAAAAFVKLGVDVYLWMDDYGNTEAYDAARFRSRIVAWMKAVGVTNSQVENHLKFDTFNNILDSDLRTVWPLLQNWFKSDLYKMEHVLDIAKISGALPSKSAKLDKINIGKPRRLLSPAVVWACFVALHRRNREARIITLSGSDEQPLWRVLQNHPELFGDLNVGACHLFMPVLDSNGAAVYIPDLLKGMVWQSESDMASTIDEFLGNPKLKDHYGRNSILGWCFWGCVMLPAIIAGEEPYLTVLDNRITSETGLREVNTETLKDALIAAMALRLLRV